MDWLDLFAVQGTLKSLLQHHSSKASILWPQFLDQEAPAVFHGRHTYRLLSSPTLSRPDLEVWGLGVLDSEKVLLCRSTSDTAGLSLLLNCGVGEDS